MSLYGVSSGIKKICLEPGQSHEPQSNGRNLIDKNVLSLVFTQLSVQEIAQSSLVCKEWHVACNDQALWKRIVMRTGMVFGEGQWRAAGVTVSEEPTFMSLGKPVAWKEVYKTGPFWSPYQSCMPVDEMQVLIPAMINGFPTTPQLLLQLFAKTLNPEACTFNDEFLKTYGNIRVERSYWIRHTIFYVSDGYATRTAGYRLPKCIEHLALAFLAHQTGILNSHVNTLYLEELEENGRKVQVWGRYAKPTAGSAGMLDVNPLQFLLANCSAVLEC